MKKFVLFFFALALATVYFLRDPLLHTGLSFVLPETVSYESAAWEEGEIVLQGVHYAEEGVAMHVDRASLSFHPTFKPLYLEMHLSVDHPEMVVSQDGGSAAFPLFLLQPHRFWGVKLEMAHGALNIQDKEESERYYFSFAPGEKKEEIGKFLLTLDPRLFHLPLLELDLQMEEGGLAASLTTEGISTSHFFQLIDTFYPPLLNGWRGNEGTLAMKVGAFFAPDFSFKLLRAELAGQGVSFFHPGRNLVVEASNLQGKIFLPLFSLHDRPLLSELVANFSVQGGAGYTLDGMHALRKIEGDLLLEPEKDPLFNLQGELLLSGKTVPLALSGKGEIKEGGTFWAQAHFAIADGSATAAEVSISCHEQKIEALRYLGEIEGIPALLELEQTALSETGYSLTGRAQIDNSCAFDCGAFFESSALIPHSGWFHSTSLPSSFSQRVVKKLFPELDLQAEIELFGTINGEGVELSVQTEEMKLFHPRAIVQVPHVGMETGKAILRYGFASKELSAEIPFAGAAVQVDGQVLSDVSGVCKFFNEQLFIEKMRAHWNDVLFEGELTLANLRQDPHCRASGRVMGAHFETADVKLSDLSGTLDLDSYAQTVTLSNGHAELHVGKNAHFPAQIAKITLKNQESRHVDFDLVLLEGKQEALRLTGTANEIASKRWSVQFDPNLAHFYRTKLGKTELVLEESGRMSHLEASLAMGGDELTKQLKFLRTCGFIGFDPALVSLEKATVLLHYSSIFSFEAEGKKLRIGSNTLGDFRVKGSKQKEEWRIEQLKVGEIFLQTAFCVSGSKIDLLRFDLRLPEISCVGKAKVNVDFSTYRLEGELQLDAKTAAPSLSVSSRGNIFFTFTPQSGMKIKSADLLLPEKNGTLKVEEISINPTFSRAEIKKASLTTLAPLFGAPAWELRELFLSKEQTGWAAKGNTSYQSRPLCLQMQISKEKRVTLAICEQEEANGLRIQGKMGKAWEWEAVQGDFAGLTCDLAASKKQENELSGFVKVDLARLSHFLPKEGKEFVTQFKLGKGFELIGDFHLPKEGSPTFQGKLLGRQFNCMGYLFETLDASATLSYNQILLSQFSVRDRGVKMQIKTAKIQKNSSNWQIDAPLIQMHEFSPSLIRREKGQSQEARPLVIKNFTLCELQGSVNEPATLRARGHLNFTNAFKKENSLLDLPLELIKDFGLDPNLVTPVYGEIDVELKAGRLYLRELRNAYSDARRSEFYLSEERPSYIDLQGNIHIDIKMKQNVTLKLIEPFTLKVRGTVAKPRLGF